MRFKPFSLKEIDHNANEFGPIHNSRRGLAAYYRYQPRRISARVEAPDQGLPDPTTLVMQNPDMGGHGLLRSVKIHKSVFERIRSGTDGYAPVVLPASYEVVRTDGTPAPEGETSEAAAERLGLEDGTVWNDIWRRRVNYYLTVAASLLLILMPWFTEASNEAACQGPQCFVVPVISGLGAFLPGFAQRWLDTFEQHPGLFLTGVVVLVLLLFRGGSLQRDTHDAMRALWASSLVVAGGAPARSKIRRWFDPKIYRMRRHPAYQGILQALKWRLAPHALGFTIRVAAILLVLALPLTAFQRVRLVMAERSNEICAPEWAGGPADPDRAEQGLFATSLPCWPAGRVIEGQRYHLDLKITEPWADAGHEVRPDPAGAGDSAHARPLFRGAVPPLSLSSLVSAARQDRPCCGHADTACERAGAQVRRSRPQDMQRGVRGGAVGRPLHLRERRARRALGLYTPLLRQQ